jgi:hypothetical protein
MAGRVKGGAAAAETRTSGAAAGIFASTRIAVGAEAYRADKRPALMKLWRLAIWKGGSLPTNFHTGFAPHFNNFVESGNGVTLVNRNAAVSAYGTPLIDIGGGGADEFNRGVNHGSLGPFNYSTGGFVDGDA